MFRSLPYGRCQRCCPGRAFPPGRRGRSPPTSWRPWRPAPSVAESACTQPGRSPAPAPVLPASAKPASAVSVRSFQPAKPSGAMCAPRRQSSTAVLPVGRHGLPRYTLPAGQSETKSQSQNTKPSPSAAPEGAVTQLCARPLSTVRRVQCSNRASAPPKIKSMSPAISQAW